MNSLNVRTGDTVIVITGKDKGKKGKVLECYPSTGRIMVDGTKAFKKHKKPRSAQDKAGIINITGTMDVSNVMIICPKCGKPTRVGHAFDAKGKKSRVCKNAECGAVLDKGKSAIKKKKDEKVAEEKVKKTAAKETGNETDTVLEDKAAAPKKAAKPAADKEAKPAAKKETVKKEENKEPAAKKVTTAPKAAKKETDK